MKDQRRNPGYSSYTPQLFMSQLDVEEYGLLQEKLYKFPEYILEAVRSDSITIPTWG